LYLQKDERQNDMKQEMDPVKHSSFRNSGWLFAGLCMVAVGCAFVGAWLVTAGPLDPVAHTADFLVFLVSPWMLATYVVALALVAFGAWYLQTAPKRAVGAPMIETAMKRQALGLTIALLVVASSLAVIGYLYSRDLASTSQADRASQQEAVARLKAQEIGKWLLERAIDAELLATSLRGLPLDRLPADQDVQRAVQLQFAEALASNSERTTVSLIAADGRVLSHIGEGSMPDRETLTAAAALATNPEQRKSIVDVHLDGMPPQPRMVFLVPLTEHRGTGPATAILAIAVDPFAGLFAQIESWPTASPSSEVVVVRREGADVVFITPPPRLEPVPKPLEFRVPLEGSTLPAARAVVQGDGEWIGPDYRGVEVLTASRRVNGVPWIVVAKTDVAEITQPLRRKELTLTLVIGAAVVLAACMLIVLWRGEYASLLAFQVQQREERSAITNHFERLVRMARDIVLLTRPDGLIIEANEAAVAAYGYSESELRSLNVRDLQPPEELARFNAIWDATDTASGVLVEGAHRRKDGSIFPVEISGRAFDVDGSIYRQSFVRDITQRKELEREVVRLSRVQKALQAANSVLLRAGAEVDLYHEMCEILVHLGGYRLACVSAPNNDAGKTIRFLAIAGVDDGYLAQAAVSWGDGPRSTGPTGGALRTGQVQVNQDFETNPAMAPWRVAALQRNFHASIGIPLKIEGKIFAALTLYAEQPNAFSDEETRMLVALAEDISFAALRLRQGTGRNA
jgi:PAS domain S-box-containing protein